MSSGGVVERYGTPDPAEELRAEWCGFPAGPWGIAFSNSPLQPPKDLPVFCRRRLKQFFTSEDISAYRSRAIESERLLIKLKSVNEAQDRLAASARDQCLFWAEDESRQELAIDRYFHFMNGITEENQK
ncbi:hypothetical protein [Acetobacter senegalensis]|uniref:hypothetical protein n=1 Tax=Acetobacter senegalensis TaxID=446692 RepID=UPI001EE13959|nr:hypothetical protein [Acetobacter senegalensis]MCG4274306.1 hypothetical protein [Acetobacter senegalensis]